MQGGCSEHLCQQLFSVSRTNSSGFSDIGSSQNENPLPFYDRSSLEVGFVSSTSGLEDTLVMFGVIDHT